MRTWFIALCLLAAAARTGQTRVHATPLPSASGNPSIAVYQAIERAGTRWARQQSLKTCTSFEHCDRTTVLVDGRPVSPNAMAVLAQNTYRRQYGARATTAGFATALANERSDFFRRVLAATATEALLALDAGPALSPAQRAAVEARLTALARSVSRGEIRVSLGGSSGPLTARQLAEYVSLERPHLAKDELLATIKSKSDPAAALHAFIAASLRRHRVQFTAGSGLRPADVLAFTDQASASGMTL